MSTTPSRQPAAPDLALGLPEHDVLVDADGTEWDWAGPDATVLEAGDLNGMGMLVDTSKAAEGVFSYDVVDYYADNRVVGTCAAANLAEVKDAAKDARYKMALYVNGGPRFTVGDMTPWARRTTSSTSLPASTGSTRKVTGLPALRRAQQRDRCRLAHLRPDVRSVP